MDDPVIYAQAWLRSKMLKDGVPLPGPDLRSLTDQGWHHVYSTLFGSFVDVLGPHHKEALEWHWNSRIAFLTGEHPEYLAYFPIWSRGHMKSTCAERMVVVDALLHVAYKTPGYCLYVARNKDKVQEHIANIEALLASPAVKYWCPKLSTPQRTEITNQQRRWTSSFLKTEANYSIQGGTLDSGLAGSRVEETRPTYIALDDIDDREDSPVIAETRFRQLTSGILPMRQDDTLVFFAQNLISRFSVMYRIHSGQARVLTNRKPVDPIPAVTEPFITETRTIDGIVKDVFIPERSGSITWPAWDARRVQDEIDTEGLSAFERECNHKVEESKEGVILDKYDDNVHVISESEFENVFGKDAWLSWRKKPGNDWARTKTDKHANVAGWLCVSPSSSPLPNFTFLMHPMSFPANSAAEDVAERLLSCLGQPEPLTWAQLRIETLRRTNAEMHTKTVAEKIAYEHGELAKIIPKYSKPILQRCNVQQGEMSHEQDTVRHIYSSVYGIAMRGTNPRKHGGVESINRAMRVDYDMDHAFRPGKGYTQWAMVVPDDLAQPYEHNGKTLFKPRPYPLAFQTNDLVDSDLWRFQLSNWRVRPPTLTAAGEVIDEPEKLYDDAPNLMQMWYVGLPLSGTSLTFEQRVSLIVPQDAVQALEVATTAGDKLSAQINYEFQRSIAEEILTPPEDVWDDWE